MCHGSNWFGELDAVETWENASNFRRGLQSALSLEHISTNVLLGYNIPWFSGVQEF